MSFFSSLRRQGAPLGLTLLGALAFGGLLLTGGAEAEQPARLVPAPTLNEKNATSTSETAILAGGCFWGVQGVFQHVKGVSDAVSGYAGGEESTAAYEQVGTGTTGHAESVKVTFDPSVISYGEILQIYFSVAHDPTELNRQGPDTGPQYRSTIFPTSASQAKVAQAYVEQLNAEKAYDRTVVTTIEPGKAFYPAEGYHQDFLALNPQHPYIVRFDLPKIEDLRRLFPGDFSDKPVLTADASAASN